MDRVAVFVDAGYLYAGGSTALCGEARKRTELSLNVAVAVDYISHLASQLAGMPLLRIYWYDGSLNNRLATDHQLLAASDRVKLRLGIINGFGEQKGVDARIITDLADLARNRAFCDAVLLGGDEDLRIGVELAQERGARVHLLTIQSASSSGTLRQEADTVTSISAEEVRTFLSVTLAPAIAAPNQGPLGDLGTPQDRLSQASAEVELHTDFASALSRGLDTYISSLRPTELEALRNALRLITGVPAEHDGRLLARMKTALGRPLTTDEKVSLRQALRQHIGLA